MFVFKMFFVPWLITIAAEGIAAAFWGLKNGKEYLAILWINTVTNLSVTGIRYLSNQTIPSADIRTGILILLELLVLLAEWRLFGRFIKRVKHPFLMSLTLNAASFGAGYLAPYLYMGLAKIGM